MPQSSSIFLPFFNVRRCFEPVTVRAAPWKAIFINEFSYFFDLKDQLTKNSATTSPASFLPVDLAFTTRGSPVRIASSIILLNRSPSSQVKYVLPVAFLE